MPSASPSPVRRSRSPGDAGSSPDAAPATAPRSGPCAPSHSPWSPTTGCRCTWRWTSSPGSRTRGRRRTAVVDEPPLTLVFCHGYALNLDCWHFQRAGYRGLVRAVYYDQRSHGRSGRSTEGGATIDQLGHDLKQVLDHVVPEGPVVLIGHSMGGMSIVALAEHYPELFGDRVIGVGLISTTAGGLDPHRILVPVMPVDDRRPAGGPPGRRARAGTPTGRRVASGGQSGRVRRHGRARVRGRGAGELRVVRGRDAFGDAVRGGRGVLPGRRLNGQVRDRGLRSAPSRPRSSAAPRTRSRRSGTAASCTRRSPTPSSSSAREPVTW